MNKINTVLQGIGYSVITVAVLFLPGIIELLVKG